MHPSSGHKGEKTNEHQQDPEVYPAVKSLKNLKQGRKLFFFFPLAAPSELQGV